ncbi:hypothetical protein NFI96_004378 [Prochilodus magdalenae]|nr:hypothetical protein NFI96_004378 [Prochilodus magdalenae]
MKKLASFASIAPGIGTVISSVVNTVLIFIPQTDPVLVAVQEGFAEVNRKLDSLSTKVTNLATDVEWYNFVSIYSQDEVRILNAWRKFDEFFNKQSFNDINVLAELFTNYYEYTQTEASVANFYQYLTVRTTSLTENINDLLIKKFKCDLNQIMKYNMYFSTLLWKGMVLNQIYWKLIGFNTTGKEAEHAQMFKNVYEAQWAVVESCKNSEPYVTDDVERIAKESPGDKEAIARKLKTTLDEKYSWYNWVVLVYEKSNEDGKYIYTYGMIKIPVADKIIVAVDYTRKSDEGRESSLLYNIRRLGNECFSQGQECKFKCSLTIVGQSGHEDGTLQSTDYIRATHATYNYEPVVFPAPLYKSKCKINGYEYQVSVYTSIKWPVCKHNPCRNNGQCKRLLNSNEWLCVCQDGYHGDTCEEKMTVAVPQTVSPLPVVATTKARLKSIESTLENNAAARREHQQLLSVLFLNSGVPNPGPGDLPLCQETCSNLSLTQLIQVLKALVGL